MTKRSVLHPVFTSELVVEGADTQASAQAKEAPEPVSGAFFDSEREFSMNIGNQNDSKIWNFKVSQKVFQSENG